MKKYIAYREEDGRNRIIIVADNFVRANILKVKEIEITEEDMVKIRHHHKKYLDGDKIIFEKSDRNLKEDQEVKKQQFKENAKQGKIKMEDLIDYIINQ